MNHKSWFLFPLSLDIITQMTVFCRNHGLKLNMFLEQAINHEIQLQNIERQEVIKFPDKKENNQLMFSVFEKINA